MVFPQRVENRLDVATMFFKVVGPNDDIVEIDVTNGTDVRAQGRIHATLMCTGRVAASLRHDRPFVETEGGGDSRVLNMVGMYACLKERVSHVEFPPDLTARAV